MASDSGASFRPTASWANLRLRADLLARTRAFFAARGYLEVETPTLSFDTVVDRHLDPFVSTLAPDPRRPEVGQEMYLQTSPELGMKRLLAAGGEAIYQITRSYRNGEVGRLHNPEFTMVEWYRVGDGLREQMAVLAELAQVLLEPTGRWSWPVETLTYGEAFGRYVGIDPHTAAIAELAEVGAAHKLAFPASLAPDDRDGRLDLLLVELVEPQLGQQQPVILYDYPASQSALAQVRTDAGQPPVAERFELYVDGIELANGYHELLDASVLRERNHQQNAWRTADGKPTLPVESRLLEAMEAGLPRCAGVALGFDRVVMLAAGAKDIREVIAFPADRA